MKITNDQLKAGMVLYSVPCNFDNPNPDNYKVFVVEHGLNMMLIPSLASADSVFSKEEFSLRGIEGLHTTWESALVAAMDSQRIDISISNIRMEKIKILIDVGRAKNEI